MHHFKFDEAKILADAGVPVLLTGEKGSGKTTIAMQIAEELKLPFYSVSLTRQTTLSFLLGFMNVNGQYIPSLLRKAAEEGGMYLMDELDAGDPNVLLSLNTIENGYIAFPDQIVKLHKDFRWFATSNPQNEHHHYTGRAKLDAATLDRFDQIEIPRDDRLERTLVDADTLRHINAAREALKEVNATSTISMRDSLRYQKRKELKLLEGFIPRLFKENPLATEKYENLLKTMPKHTDQSDCVTIEDLIELASKQSDFGVSRPSRYETTTKE
jgi:MoxR-like ATPase